MYERSAIVLERYFEQLFGFNKENNLKENYDNYKKNIEEVKEYQKIVIEEEKVIGKFEEVASEIEEIQNKQSELHESNLELENERNRLFNDLSENPNTLDIKLQKIEEKLEKNSQMLIKLREKYVKALVIFTERQKERNKYARIRRVAEENHRNNIEEANKMFDAINIEDAQKIKRFIDSDKVKYVQEITNIMLKNGKNEKKPFDEHVIDNAVKTRMEIAKKEAELYISIYEKTKKFLGDLNNENIKLARAEKLLRDVSVKLAFLKAEKEYIVGFLDNERMTSMNNKKVHEKMMEEACKNFNSDIVQIDKLYELIIKETTGKSTKKAYKELYNKTYLKDIEEKEKNFEEEITNMNIKMGTVINSNYWRIEGIKNIYNVFQIEISDKFNKDLSEYRIDEIEGMLQENKEKSEYCYDLEETDEETYNEDEENEIYEDEYDGECEEYEEDREKNTYEEHNDNELIEDKIDQIIKNSRKNQIKGKKEKSEKGLLGRWFKR